MRLLFATSNPHKIREVSAILDPLGIEIVGLDALAEPPEPPVEDGQTFQANARIKALGYAAATGTLCLAEDSGLEVDALEGAPGVHSARYARDETNPARFDAASRAERDQANNRKLLRALRGVPAASRTARFVCAMCLADPMGRILLETRGTFEGSITFEPRGSGGFGYDPLLLVAGLDQTSAELTADEKNARSHRGAAARELARALGGLDLAGSS